MFVTSRVLDVFAAEHSIVENSALNQSLNLSEQWAFRKEEAEDRRTLKNKIGEGILVI